MGVGKQGVIKFEFCSSVKEEDFLLSFDNVIDIYDRILRHEPLLPTSVFDNEPSHRGIEDHLSNALPEIHIC